MGKTRTRTAAAIVPDAGALIALDRGDKRMIALLDRALAQRRAFRVPAGVVGQAWRDVENCAPPQNSPDVIDASVVILARERRDTIVTSDPNDLRRLDPAARIIAV